MEYIYQKKYRKNDYVTPQVLFEDVREWFVPAAMACATLYPNNSSTQYFQKIDRFNNKLNINRNKMPIFKERAEKIKVEQSILFEEYREKRI